MSNWYEYIQDYWIDYSKGKDEIIAELQERWNALDQAQQEKISRFGCGVGEWDDQMSAIRTLVYEFENGIFWDRRLDEVIDALEEGAENYIDYNGGAELRLEFIAKHVPLLGEYLEWRKASKAKVNGKLPLKFTSYEDLHDLLNQLEDAEEVYQIQSALYNVQATIQQYGHISKDTLIAYIISGSRRSKALRTYINWLETDEGTGDLPVSIRVGEMVELHNIVREVLTDSGWKWE